MARSAIALCVVTFSLPTATPVRGSSSQDAGAAQTSGQTPSQQDRVREAEELLRQLRRRPAGGEVIPPASAQGEFPVRIKPGLLPEGSAVVGQVGTITTEDGWWVFHPQASLVDSRACKLLPNATLEALVRMSRTAAQPLVFAISGELTVFRGENYLLARTAVRAEALPTQGGAVSSVRPSAGVPVSQVHGADEPAAPSWDAGAEDVLERMRAVAPQAPAVLPDDNRLAETPRSRVREAAYLEGTSLVGRAGRLVREGDGWNLTFDSDRPEQSEDAFRLLPNRALEFMTQAAENNFTGLRFVVSGEITEFEGQNFLLVRSVTRPADAGNLRR